jgi:hypothetical protein
LLLGDAVNSATVSKKHSSASPLDPAPWVEVSEKIECLVIVWIIESANNHETVANVVIDIRVVGPSTVIGQYRRRNDLDDFESSTRGIFAGTKKGYEFFRHFVVGVCRVKLAVCNNQTWPDEGGNDVHVSTSAELVVVTGQASR